MKNKLNIFISAPDDVNNEKEIIKKVVKNLNSIYADSEHYSFNIYKPENHVPNINYDIFIGILWKTFRTEETSRKIEEEFEKALTTNIKSMFYFSNIPISPDEIDIQELNKILKLKEKVSKEKLYYEYNTLNAFENLIYNNLRILATEKKDNSNENIDTVMKEEKGIFDLMEEFISNFENAEKDMKNIGELFEKSDEKTKKIPQPTGEDIKEFIIYANSVAEVLDELSDEFEISKIALVNHFSDGINSFIELIGPYNEFIEENEMKKMIISIKECIDAIDQFDEQMIEISNMFDEIPPITKKLNNSKQRLLKNLKNLTKDFLNFKGMLYASLEEIN